jgi:hypothetical protein
MDPVTTIVGSLAIAGITGGISAWGAAKRTEGTINGMKERSVRIEDKIDAYMDDSHDFKVEVSERLTRIETKLED